MEMSSLHCAVCQSVALFQCGACLQRYYCSPVCAKKDWSLHYCLIEGKRRRDDWERYYTCAGHTQWLLDTQHFVERGAEGAVFAVCKTQSCFYVAKITEPDLQFLNEVRTYKILEQGVAKGKPRVSPVFYDAFQCTLNRNVFGKQAGARVGIIILEKLHQSLFEALEGGDLQLETEAFTQSVRLVRLLQREYNMTHNDAHARNVMYRFDGRMVLIDFSYAHLNPSDDAKQNDLYMMYEDNDYDYLTAKQADKIVDKVLRKKE